MRIILTIGAALVLGSMLMHAEPAECHGRQCRGIRPCIGGGNHCSGECFCSAPYGREGVCIGPGN